jgi:hypothetical protein
MKSALRAFAAALTRAPASEFTGICAVQKWERSVFSDPSTITDRDENGSQTPQAISWRLTGMRALDSSLGDQKAQLPQHILSCSMETSPSTEKPD